MTVCPIGSEVTWNDENVNAGDEVQILNHTSNVADALATMFFKVYNPGGLRGARFTSHWENQNKYGWARNSELNIHFSTGGRNSIGTRNEALLSPLQCLKRPARMLGIEDVVMSFLDLGSDRSHKKYQPKGL
jgi:hypothetical protein